MFFFNQKWASWLDVTIEVWATDVSEYPTFTFGLKTYQDVLRWFVKWGQNVDGLGRKISLVAGSLETSGTPAGVQDGLAGRVLVENDQVAPGKVQEWGALT